MGLEGDQLMMYDARINCPGERDIGFFVNQKSNRRGTGHKFEVWAQAVDFPFVLSFENL